MAVNQTVRTTLGQEASAYLLANGGTLNFTRIALGSGECNIPHENMTALADAKIDLSIQAVEYKGGTQVRVRARLDNSELASDLVYREIGLFAIDPQSNEEILFEYGNAKTAQSDYTETIPSFSGSGSRVMRFFDLDAFVANAVNATFTIDNEGKADIITVQNIRADLTAETTARTTGDATTLATAKDYTDAVASGKANTSHSHSDATTSASGFMSSSDKSNLDKTVIAFNRMSLGVSSIDLIDLIKTFSPRAGTTLKQTVWSETSSVDVLVNGVTYNTSDYDFYCLDAVGNLTGLWSKVVFRIQEIKGDATSDTEVRYATTGNTTVSTSVKHLPIDNALSSTSTNPVQNNVLYTALADKSDINHTHTGEELSTQINLLGKGDSAPTDSDTFVAQYAGGGTENTTFVRRSMSALWNWIKGKTDAVYATLAHTHNNATIIESGFMSASDKAKLNNFAGLTGMSVSTIPGMTYSNMVMLQFANNDVILWINGKSASATVTLPFSFSTVYSSFCPASQNPTKPYDTATNKLCFTEKIDSQCKYNAVIFARLADSQVM